MAMMIGELKEERIVQLSPMERELRELLRSIETAAVAELAEAFLSSEFYNDFCQGPAAQRYHHNYAGGLLEHSLGTAEIALKIAELHPEVDRDLMLIGALLHDLGKVQEMTIDLEISYSDEGKLLGHIVLGIRMLEQLMERANTERVLRNKLLHMIASHHGRHEWQSPKKPMFLEAQILHLADMMDAEIWKFKSAAASAKGSPWSPYMKTIGSEVYLD